MVEERHGATEERGRVGAARRAERSGAAWRRSGTLVGAARQVERSSAVDERGRAGAARRVEWSGAAGL